MVPDYDRVLGKDDMYRGYYPKEEEEKFKLDRG